MPTDPSTGTRPRAFRAPLLVAALFCFVAADPSGDARAIEHARSHPVRRAGPCTGAEPAVANGAPVRTPAGFDLLAPLVGTLTSGFGPRPDPLLDKIRTHDGIDIAAPAGAIVRAAGPGRIVSVTEDDAYGTLVTVDHGGGTETRYAHLSRALVAVGDGVGRGDRIGGVGSSGRTTGPHLHFELRVDGAPVDPSPWLRETEPR